MGITNQSRQADGFTPHNTPCTNGCSSTKSYRMVKQIVEVHIDTIRWGDTVVVDGVEKTVGKRDIKYGGFCGTVLFGDSYVLGRVPVLKVIYRKEPTP